MQAAQVGGVTVPEGIQEMWRCGIEGCVSGDGLRLH